MNNIIWKSINKNNFEASSDKFDFYIRKEGKNNWVLDIFDSNEPDNDCAHLESESFASLDLAQDYAKKY